MLNRAWRTASEPCIDFGDLQVYLASDSGENEILVRMKLSQPELLLSASAAYFQREFTDTSVPGNRIFFKPLRDIHHLKSVAKLLMAK